MSTFSTLNPTTVGEPTKKSDYDIVFENTLALSTFLLSRDLTNHGVLLGSGTGAITPTVQMTTNMILIGQGTGADPEPKAVSGDVSLTSAGVVTVGAAAISQSKLKTTFGEVTKKTTIWTKHTLPGGQYGFYPNYCGRPGGQMAGIHIVSSHVGIVSTVYINSVDVGPMGSTEATAFVMQRYVAASGEIFWIFLLRDKTTKKIKETWIGPDHPCMGNSGKPLLRPHPFGGYNPETDEIVLINPTPEQLQDIRERTIQPEDKADLTLWQSIKMHYEIDEDSRPDWPTKEVTVGLPHKWEDAWHTGQSVQSIKKVIPKCDYVLCRNLKPKE